CCPLGSRRAPPAQPGAAGPPGSRAVTRSTRRGRRPARDNEEAVMRKFSVRPTLTLKGRKFKGLRGWSGKPLHPPLTDFPIVAYVVAAVFDVVSVIRGKGHGLAHDLWHAGTYLFLIGVAVSVLAALTGLW